MDELMEMMGSEEPVAASPMPVHSQQDAGVLPLVPASQDTKLSDVIAQDHNDCDDIDALCELIEAGGEVAKSVSSPEDVEELLGALAPEAARTSPRISPKHSPLDRALSATGEGEESDLPEPTLALPPEVRAVPFTMVAKFHLKCDVDLKKVAFGLKHAEYNPRKHGSITMRIFEPRTVALVRHSGAVSITGTTDHMELKSAAKKVTRLIQRAGIKEAKFANYSVTSVLCKATLGFPVRLDLMAASWRRNAMYEPELYCGCVFRTRKPRCTYLVTAGGKVMISGTNCIEDAQESLRLAYPVFREYTK